jgi:hypothetical protein
MVSEPMGTVFNKPSSKVDEDKDIERAVPVLEQPDHDRRGCRISDENDNASTRIQVR